MRGSNYIQDLRADIILGAYHVQSQRQFNNLFERVAAFQYKLKDNITEVVLHFLSGGYLFSPVLSGGDSYGYIETNNCITLICEGGAYINPGDNNFYIEVNTDHCYLKNVYVKGIGSIAAAIARSFLLNANYVTFDNCKTSDRLSNINMTGFEESSTVSHQETVVYKNCKTFDMDDAVLSYRNGFSYNKNLVKCMDEGILLLPQVNWTTPQLVGNLLDITGSGAPFMTALNSTDIAYVDAGNDALRTYRFDGVNWTLVGSELAISGGFSQVGLGTLNATDIAYIDATNKDLRTYRFNGSTWSQVGSDLNIPGLGVLVTMDALSSTDVAIVDYQNQLAAYRFNGSTWSQVGSALSLATNSNARIAALNATDIAYFDNTDQDLRTYRFNGSTWSQVGSDLNISGAAFTAMCTLNRTDIVFKDNTTKFMQVYRFNGSTWSLQSTYDFISGTVGDITALNSTDIAFMLSGGGDLRTFRYSYFPK